MPMAASQYPATATPAGDRMTEPMIAMGTHRRPGTGCPRPGWRLPGRVLNPVNAVTVGGQQAAPALARRRQP